MALAPLPDSPGGTYVWSPGASHFTGDATQFHDGVGADGGCVVADADSSHANVLRQAVVSYAGPPPPNARLEVYDDATLVFACFLAPAPGTQAVTLARGIKGTVGKKMIVQASYPGSGGYTLWADILRQ